jgi:dTDP-4-dehydrorhamnose reductase
VKVGETVLVTGARGLLGTTLSTTLEARGWSVVRHGRRNGDVFGDLTNRRIAAEVVTQSSIDCIINLAALTDVDSCETNPSEAYAQNTRIVENLVAAIRESQSPAHLVQVSTDQVYDGQGPHLEDDVRLTNYYGFSKIAGELAASKTRSTIVRTNFFGLSRREGRSSFSDWLVSSLQRQALLRVFDDVWFSPLSLEQLSEYIAFCAERRIPGVFNLGSREGMTKADFCYALARSLHLSTATMSRINSSEAALKAYRPKDMRMDCGRFASVFDVTLPTLEQEIESMKRYYNV